MNTWADLPLAVTSKFFFRPRVSNPMPGQQGFTPAEIIQLQAVIANIYFNPNGLGASLINSKPGPITFTLGEIGVLPVTNATGTEIFVDVGALLSAGDTSSSGNGFINSSGVYVAFTPERLLFHELTHISPNATTDNQWVFNQSPNWAQLTGTTVPSLTGGAVDQENAFANTAYRPSYLSAGAIAHPCAAV